MSQLVEIAAYPDEWLAEMARAYLESCGIEAVVYNDCLGQMYGTNLTGHGVRLVVAAEKLDEAQELLQAMELPAED